MTFTRILCATCALIVPTSLSATTFYEITGLGWSPDSTPLRGYMAAEDINGDFFITTPEVLAFELGSGGRSVGLPELQGQFFNGSGIRFSVSPISNVSLLNPNSDTGERLVALGSSFGVSYDETNSLLVNAGGVRGSTEQNSFLPGQFFLGADVDLSNKALRLDVVDVALPETITDIGEFVFDIDETSVAEDEIFWIDPEIAIAYKYEVENSSFSKVQAPPVGWVADGDGEYLLSFGDAEISLLAGQEYVFEPGVTEFTLSGIDRSLMLDPDDPTAFVTGIALSSVQPGIVVTQTPIVAPVPLPHTAALLLGGLILLGSWKHRRAKLT